MKRVVIFILGLILVISGTTIISYNILASGKEVKYVDDILNIQKDKEEYYSCYGYSFDNPKIVINPYDISLLSALVMFENNNTDDIEVMVMGKDDNSNIGYSVRGSKCNYIPIYGLYSDYDNRVILKNNNKVKEITIKTLKIDDISNDIKSGDKDLVFIDRDKYVYAVDKNGDIRWYINNYGGKLDSYNGHFLLHSDKDIGNDYYSGLVEIDMLGKIYYDYYIDKGYIGNYVKIDNSIYINSDGYVNYVSLLNGSIIKSYRVKDKYDYIDVKDNKIICSNRDKSISIDIDNKKIKDIDNSYKDNNIYYNDLNIISNYNKIGGKRFGYYKNSEINKRKIWLFNYDKLGKRKIDIYKEYNRLVVKGDFTDKSYIILDGIKGKKVYKIDKYNDKYYKYIYDKKLSGRYNIYFEIDGILYKSDYFVKF